MGTKKADFAPCPVKNAANTLEGRMHTTNSAVENVFGSNSYDFEAPAFPKQNPIRIDIFNPVVGSSTPVLKKNVCDAHAVSPVGPNFDQNVTFAGITEKYVDTGPGCAGKVPAGQNGPRNCDYSAEMPHTAVNTPTIRPNPGICREKELYTVPESGICENSVQITPNIAHIAQNDTKKAQNNVGITSTTHESSLGSDPLSYLSQIASDQARATSFLPPSNENGQTCENGPQLHQSPPSVPSIRIRDISAHMSLFDELMGSKVAHIEVVVLVQMMLLSFPVEIRSTVVSVLYPSFSHYDTWTETRHLLYYYCLRVVISIVQNKDVTLGGLYVALRGALLLPMPGNTHELPTNSLGTVMRSLSKYHRANMKERTTMRRYTKLDYVDMFQSYPRRSWTPFTTCFNPPKFGKRVSRVYPSPKTWFLLAYPSISHIPPPNGLTCNEGGV